ncbi:hypothetical protein Vi05172_g11125 [Venturia inaequalis]|nr:hypothetical protein Vi05172_g11125 [Venturia inaequalis]
MLSKSLTVAAFALAASASPIMVGRQESPKPAKATGGMGLEALGSLGMMSSSDVKKGDFSCKKAALLFARGTGEPANMGYVVGPGLGTGLKKALGGDILIQGVDYSTNFSGGGATEMVKLVKSIISKCPNTKIVLGGYSQGAMQVHQALGSLGGDAAKVSVAVTFGDPYSNQGWGTGGMVGSFMGLGAAGSAAGGGGVGGFNPNNGLIICSSGDFVCGLVPNIGGSVPKATASDTKPAKGGAGHISYSMDGSIPKAITFITTRIEGKGETAPEAAPKSATKPKPKAGAPPAEAAEAATAERTVAADDGHGLPGLPAGPKPSQPKPLPKSTGELPSFPGDLPPAPADSTDEE